MEDIKMGDLKPGDVFAFEIKVHGRCAYLVETVDLEKNKVQVINRNTNLPETKTIDYTKYIKLLKRTEIERKRAGLTLQ